MYLIFTAATFPMIEYGKTAFWVSHDPRFGSGFGQYVKLSSQFGALPEGLPTTDTNSQVIVIQFCSLKL